jgi:hypothetical protein
MRKQHDVAGSFRLGTEATVHTVSSAHVELLVEVPPLTCSHRDRRGLAANRRISRSRG